MSSKSKQTWVYDGPYDAVDVHLPTRWITIKRADTVQLLPSEANAVRELPGWSQVKTTTNTNEGAS